MVDRSIASGDTYISVQAIESKIPAALEDSQNTYGTYMQNSDLGISRPPKVKIETYM
jgi:hypothetical protein